MQKRLQETNEVFVDDSRCVLTLCWHPRCVLPASRVAPVRGGTYFLCRGKESKGISAKDLALTPTWTILGSGEFKEWRDDTARSWSGSVNEAHAQA